MSSAEQRNWVAQRGNNSAGPPPGFGFPWIWYPPQLVGTHAVHQDHPGPGAAGVATHRLVEDGRDYLLARVPDAGGHPLLFRHRAPHLALAVQHSGRDDVQGVRGTVLHRRRRRPRPSACARFSPLDRREASRCPPAASFFAALRRAASRRSAGSMTMPFASKVSTSKRQGHVHRVQTGHPGRPVNHPFHLDLTKHRRQRPRASPLSPGAHHAVAARDRVNPPFLQRPQAQVVLEQAPQQFHAVGVQAFLHSPGCWRPPWPRTTSPPATRTLPASRRRHPAARELRSLRCRPGRSQSCSDPATGSPSSGSVGSRVSAGPCLGPTPGRREPPRAGTPPRRRCPSRQGRHCSWGC